MNLNTQPSLIFDTTILKDGIIKIPELNIWKDNDIHIVIVFKQKPTTQDKHVKSLAGQLKKYANPDLIEKETEIAWSKIKDN
ncbi:MAG: hypothetical protein DRJ05_02140 [Bacteroidetes bacterium]|nr:MAG: hypothetical protein DRJ05_02140 [Bacteroidota bacterium]